MKVEQDYLSEERIYDVLIVGAGPVGLATAIALRQRGVNNILVIDQTSHFRKVGQVVDILPNGLKAIKYIDDKAYQQVKQTGLKFLQPQNQNNSDGKNSQVKEKNLPQKRTWCQKNLQGEIIRSTPLDFSTWLNLYGEGRVSISWYELQTTLRNLISPEIVKPNHRCISVRKENGYVEVNCTCNQAIKNNPFSNWKMQESGRTKINSIDKLENKQSIQKQFRAKLIVGADGINSTIREIIYNNLNLKKWAKPQYSGIAAIGCMQIENVSDEIAQELQAKYFQGDRLITLRDDADKSDNSDLRKPRIILLHRQKNTFGYLLHTPLSLDLLQNKSSEEVIKLAISILEKFDFPLSLKKLVALSTPEGLFQRPYYIHPSHIPNNHKHLWSNGRLVLVGDSAHGMPPFIAQGVNQGFEDAALLSTLIANLVDNKALDNEEMIKNEFSKYEQIRRPFMIKIQSATMENQSWSKQEWDNYNEMVYSRDLEQLISQV